MKVTTTGAYPVQKDRRLNAGFVKRMIPNPLVIDGSVLIEGELDEAEQASSVEANFTVQLK